MSTWLTDILQTLAPAIVLAFFTSIFTVKFALRRFHQERWWEKKQETYSSLLEALHHLKSYVEEHYEGSMDPNYITAEKNEALEKIWKKFSQEFSKLHDLASFQLSKEAVAILDRYRKKKKEARVAHDMCDWIEADLSAITECLNDLKVAAKKDLKVK